MKRDMPKENMSKEKITKGKMPKGDTKKGNAANTTRSNMKKTTAMKMMAAALTLTIVVPTAACGNVDKGVAQKPERITSAKDAAGNSVLATTDYPVAEKLDGTLSDGINQFAYHLAAQITGADAEVNYFFSPYSFCSALSLLDNAADGETKTQMEKLLGISDLNEWNQQLGLYMEQKQPAEAVITSANSLWLDQGFKLNDDACTDYVPTVEFYYNAQLYQADFAGNPEETKKEIAQWVSDSTDGMIDDYKSIANEGTVLDMINAVYFYGEWSIPFEAAGTSPQTFYGAAGDTEVNMMHQSFINLPYYEAEGLRAVSVPYGDGSKVMNIILSDQAQTDADQAQADADEAQTDADEAQTETPDQVFNSLSAEGKNNFLTALMNSDTTLLNSFQLPKFDMIYQMEGAAEILKAMGMTNAFDAKLADFSRLGDIYVSNIGHMAKLEVDELGSRAAAVTEIAAATGMIEGDDLIDFIVDQPFLFFIQDKETGVILFMGRVNDLNDVEKSRTDD